MMRITYSHVGIPFERLRDESLALDGRLVIIGDGLNHLSDGEGIQVPLALGV
jgi:hypothetical protein